MGKLLLHGVRTALHHLKVCLVLIAVPSSPFVQATTPSPLTSFALPDVRQAGQGQGQEPALAASYVETRGPRRSDAIRSIEVEVRIRSRVE
jgi:hypothetical protein